MEKPQLKNYVKEIGMVGGKRLAGIDFAQYAFDIEKYIQELEKNAWYLWYGLAWELRKLERKGEDDSMEEITELYEELIVESLPFEDFAQEYMRISGNNGVEGRAQARRLYEMLRDNGYIVTEEEV